MLASWDRDRAVVTLNCDDIVTVSTPRLVLLGGRKSVSFLNSALEEAASAEAPDRDTKFVTRSCRAADAVHLLANRGNPRGDAEDGVTHERVEEKIRSHLKASAHLLSLQLSLAEAPGVLKCSRIHIVTLGGIAIASRRTNPF
jgi:hypothetical protein